MTDTPEDTDAGQQVRPFAAVFTEINGGRVAAEASRGLQELAASVADLRRKGKVVITLELSPRKGSENALNIAASVVTTLPKPEPAEDVFFAGRGGVLTRDDPSQPEIPNIREVPSPHQTKEVRQV
ncbi:hypothetical protein ACRYCC_26100 [Actinomadura scrupuli]|uniref:hypothetical protein n=1 Tax=Actinomadura scrupuli TaxID=559629 RepID=UPI003D95C142